LYHLVVVNFKTPYVVDGLNNNYFSGVGLIISVKKGLVIVDRNTVLVALGDCDVVLGSSLILPEKVRFLHLIHNFGVVSYDPNLLIDSPFKSSKIDRSNHQLSQGEDVYLITSKVMAQKTIVSKVTECFVAESSVPRFRHSRRGRDSPLHW